MDAERQAHTAGPDSRPASASTPLHQILAKLRKGSPTYPRCSGSCHGNWGRQYLRVAVRLQKGRAFILCVSCASIHWRWRKVAFTAALGSDFRFPHWKVLNVCLTTVSDLQSATWPGGTGCWGQLDEWQQFLESLLWNRNTVLVHQQQRRGRHVPPSHEAGRQQSSKVMTHFRERGLFREQLA